MIISVASGKGGTGKTTVAVNLALSLANTRLIDCDVEEPNCHIFVKPDIESRRKVSIPIPQVNDDKCDGCGRCQEVCAYNAIAVVNKKVIVFPELCHGCGSCSYFCPLKAIDEKNKEIGIIEAGRKGGTDFVHGRLNIGMMMSPPVIREVKKYIDKKKTVIIDAPPGTSCPVITAIKDTDFIILVTEPTPFGLNDLSLAIGVVKKLGIPSGVIINRSDLGNKKVENYCAEENIPVLMKIPFDRRIAEIYSGGDVIVEVLPEYKNKFRDLYKKIEAIINNKK
ncbi:MAG: ATP-binding protein [Actinomycetota bacterium]|nr:ATP-binding protein [Actinomycetota bacterium]